MVGSLWRVLAALGSLAAGRAAACNADHGPFGPGAGVRRVPMTELAEVEAGGDPRTLRFATGGESAVEVAVHVGDEGTEVELLDAGRVLHARARVSEFSFPAGVEARAADLNSDGLRDYVVYAYSGGCGLAAGYCDVGFLLSDGEGYRLAVSRTLWPGPFNYLVLGGRPSFVHTGFGGVERCRDGKPHNFWVYNLVAFDGTGLRLDNRLAPGFPKTVWYSFKPNHEETTLLEPAQKAELVREAQAEAVQPSDVP